MDEKRNLDEKKNSIFQFAIGEIVIAIVLCLFIVLTLNYFRILPVSQALPFLSFLPQQAQGPTDILPQNSDNFTTKAIFRMKGVVRPYSPLRVKNDSQEVMYNNIASSSASIFARQYRIDMEIGVNNATGSSGIMFSNGKNFQDSAYRGIRIFRYPQNNNWTLEFRGDGKSTYYYLTGASKGAEFKMFAIMVGPQGRVIRVISPSFPSKDITLPLPLYTKNNEKLTAVLQTAPNSVTTLYSLYYEY